MAEKDIIIKNVTTVQCNRQSNGKMKCVVGRGLVGGFGGLAVGGSLGGAVGTGLGVYSCVRRKSDSAVQNNGGT